jgi:nucleotide-binding universal stress UspA family protein
MSNVPYRVVVGADFSETAGLALRKAFELAAQQELGEVHVLNAVQYLGEFVQMDLPEAAAYRLPLEEAQERLEAHVGAALSAWQEETKKSISRCVTYVSIESPSVALAQLATDLEADLTVIGTHGRRGLQRFLLGSVAEAVVRLAPTPVYVVRPKGHEARVPQIEPACPHCLEERKISGGERMWCAQHSEKHGRRHSYHYGDLRSQDGNLGSL